MEMFYAVALIYLFPVIDAADDPKGFWHGIKVNCTIWTILIIVIAVIGNLVKPS